MTAPETLALVGAGKMGSSLLGGWLAAGFEPRRISVYDPAPSDALRAQAAKWGFALNPAHAPAEAVVLAVKPQVLDAVAAGIAALFGRDSFLLSILAGKTVHNLAARLPASAILRAMPNTPAAVGRGVTGVFANEATRPDQREKAQFLLSGVGGVEWVERESLIDAVTAISGSGPAYVFHLVEALAEAGTQLGLPADLSLRLARATVEGSGELLRRQPDISAATLRKNVTSPGGTTQAALDVLMAPDGLTPLMVRAGAAARKRAEDLSG